VKFYDEMSSALQSIYISFSIYCYFDPKEYVSACKSFSEATQEFAQNEPDYVLSI